MLNDYKEEYESMQVPLHLKQKTLIAMKDEKMKQKHRFTKRLVLGFSSFSIAIVCFLFLILKQNPETDLIAGKVVENVKVKDGELVFNQISDNSYHFAKASDNSMKSISKEEAKEISQLTVRPFNLKGYTLERKQYFLKTEESKKIIEWSYIYKNKEIALNIQIQNIEGKFISDSTIHGNDIAIYYDEEENTIYEAYFVHEKKTYHIVAEKVNQEQFIEILTEITKKL